MKKPRAGDRGFLCSFLDRLLGVGWGSLSTSPINFWRSESFPSAEPGSELLSLLGRGLDKR